MSASDDDRWFTRVESIALAALDAGDVPIGSVLVSDSIEISYGVTEVVISGSVLAHGEVATIRKAGLSIWSTAHPLVLYTNLEPCLMCCGAALQVGVDEIVYELPAPPDGGAAAAQLLQVAGHSSVLVRQAGDIQRTRSLFTEFVNRWPDSPGCGYIASVLQSLRA